MSDCSNILISLQPSYTRAILDGKKTVELRRRRIHVENGTRIWLYSKAPTARIEGTVCVKNVCEDDLKGLWTKYSKMVGISKLEFDAYFRGCTKGCAIVLREARAISPGLDLAAMRTTVAGFHPPQFFKRLHADEVQAMLTTSKLASRDRSAHFRRTVRRGFSDAVISAVS